MLGFPSMAVAFRFKNRTAPSPKVFDTNVSNDNNQFTESQFGYAG